MERTNENIEAVTSWLQSAYAAQQPSPQDAGWARRAAARHFGLEMVPQYGTGQMVPLIDWFDEDALEEHWFIDLVCEVWSALEEG